jgi:hypothetical protein
VPRRDVDGVPARDHLIDDHPMIRSVVRRSLAHEAANTPTDADAGWDEEGLEDRWRDQPRIATAGPETLAISLSRSLGHSHVSLSRDRSPDLMRSSTPGIDAWGPSALADLAARRSTKEIRRP